MKPLDPISQLLKTERALIKQMALDLQQRKLRLKKLVKSEKALTLAFRPGHYSAMYLRETRTGFEPFYPEFKRT